MFGRLKTFLARRREHEVEQLSEEYTAMTPDERREIEAIRARGTLGEHEVLLDREAERVEEAREGRPPAYMDPPGDDASEAAAAD